MEINPLNLRTPIIIDDFSRHRYSLGIKTSHGEFVRGILQTYSPNISPVNIDYSRSSEKDWTNIHRSVVEALNVIKTAGNGKNFLINFSHGFEIDLNLLSVMVGAELNSQNIASYKEEIRNWLLSVPLNKEVNIRKIMSPDYAEVVSQLYGIKEDEAKKHIEDHLIDLDIFKYVERAETLIKILDELEKIAEGGTPICISAGNEGNNSFNLTSLINGVHVVKSTTDGLTEDYSVNNSLTNAEATGTYYIRREKVNGNAGFSVSKRGSIEVDGKIDSLAPGYKFVKEKVSKKIVAQLDPNDNISSLMKENIFPTELFFKVALEKGLLPDYFLKKLIEQGIQSPYIYVGNGPQDIMFFDINKDGRLIISENVTSPSYGTSWASPRFAANFISNRTIQSN